MKKFFGNTEGVTPIEYGIIAGLIAVAVIMTITTVGDEIAGLGSIISERLQTINATVGN